MLAISLTIAERLRRAAARRREARVVTAVTMMNIFDQIYGCAVCDVAESAHGRRYAQLHGWHTYERPTAYTVRARLWLKRDTAYWRDVRDQCDEG